MPPTNRPSAPTGADVSPFMRRKDIRKMAAALCWIVTLAARLAPKISTVNGAVSRGNVARHPMVALILHLLGDFPEHSGNDAIWRRHIWRVSPLRILCMMQR